MTTVAYKDGVIAADSLVTADGARVGTVEKIGKIKGIFYGASGNLALMQKFGTWIRGGMKGDPPEVKENEGEAFVIHGNHVVTFCHAGTDCMKVERFASGSGWRTALGAMDAGADAEMAVRVAIKSDTASGGGITVLRR